MIKTCDEDACHTFLRPQLVQRKKSDKHNYHINSLWEGNVKVKSETCEGKCYLRNHRSCQHIGLTTKHTWFCMQSSHQCSNIRPQLTTPISQNSTRHAHFVNWICFMGLKHNIGSQSSLQATITYKKILWTEGNTE